MKHVGIRGKGWRQLLRRVERILHRGSPVDVDVFSVANLISGFSEEDDGVKSEVKKSCECVAND